jgi:hypothetical protein
MVCTCTPNVLQGLNWYTAALQLDADGDAAHAFYQEQQQSQPGSSSQLQQVRQPQGTAEQAGTPLIAVAWTTAAQSGV